MLVQLLDFGTTLTKKNAAISLTHFSENSLMLSRPIPKQKASKTLVRVLEDPDPGACEASLDALLTLIEAERLQSGGKVLAEANAIPSIIKFLSSSSPTLQEKALNALERIFRLPEFKRIMGLCSDAFS
ncbi:hypothetical protein GH714_010276 [Hevea brasiliensis]|uniref:U-box domain-containing protein n=1 Tax=Hevea brasiliensis TaxID=3981 RepID=A0A6A6MM97_HEVBR|nr:hypothetical protein GH714_010276 [Hevea brasiliensis]